MLPTFCASLTVKLSAFGPTGVVGHSTQVLPVYLSNFDPGGIGDGKVSVTVTDPPAGPSARNPICP